MRPSKEDDMQSKTAERPNCYRKGMPAHSATHVIVFPLVSGPISKFSCAEHAREEYWSQLRYYVAKLVGVVKPSLEPLDVPEL
jgi:hypothetical protein